MEWINKWQPEIFDHVNVIPSDTDAAGGPGWQSGAAAGLLLMRALIRNSRMCWSIWRHKGLYLCRSSRRWSPPRSWGWIPADLHWDTHLTLHWSQHGQTISLYLALQFAQVDVGCKQRTEGRHEAEIKLYPRLSPGWQLMFIYPTDGVIASMISTQTRMTDSEHSSQLFIHGGGKHALPAQPSTCTGCQDRSCARAAGGSKIW